MVAMRFIVFNLNSTLTVVTAVGNYQIEESLLICIDDRLEKQQTQINDRVWR